MPEYVINLQVGLKLKGKLEALGATVIMTRETHDVDISNAERAMMMNDAGVDCWLRIHANGSTDPDVHGMFILVPAAGCMDTDDPGVVQKSVQLAQILLENTVNETGAKDLGITAQVGPDRILLVQASCLQYRDGAYDERSRRSSSGFGRLSGKNSRRAGEGVRRIFLPVKRGN